MMERQEEAVERQEAVVEVSEERAEPKPVQDIQVENLDEWALIMQIIHIKNGWLECLSNS